MSSPDAYDPGVKAVRGHAQALGDLGDRLAFLGHLLDRFDLEFFRVTLTTHGTSYLGLIMRLGGVYETKGDSTRSSRSHGSVLNICYRAMESQAGTDSGL